jgi:cytochrome c556
MNRLTKALALGLTLFAGMALAEAEATDPLVIAQKDLMKSFGGAAKTLGGMAKGEVAFDAAAAAAAKDVLVKGAADIPVKFKTAGNDPASDAKPEIWTGWDAFVAKADGLGKAAAGLDVASLDGIKAGMGDVGGACKACHTDYRKAE